jgi:adenosine deaminase
MLQSKNLQEPQIVPIQRNPKTLVYRYEVFNAINLAYQNRFKLRNPCDENFSETNLREQVQEC